MKTFLRLLPIAIRNLARNRRRSFFTFSAIAVGVSMLIFLDAVNRGVMKTLVDGIIRAQIGDIKVFHKGYQDSARTGRLLHLNFAYSDDLLAKVRAVPGVAGASGRIIFRGTMSNGLGDSQVFVIAVDPKHEAEACPTAEKGMVAGSHQIGEADGLDASIVNSELAATFAAYKAGEMDGGAHKEPPKVPSELGPLTLVAANAKGRNDSIDITPRGYSVSLFGLKFQYVTLGAAQRLLDMPGLVTELAVAIKEDANQAQVVADLQKVLGDDFEVYGWQTLIPEIADVNMRQQVILGVVAALLMTLVVFGIINTMLMCVRERIREIGTMTALGMQPPLLLALFIEEAVVMGMLGGSGGALLGVALSAWLGHVGIPLGSTSPMLIDGLKPDFAWSYAGSTLAGAVVVSAIAGLVPAYRAAKLKPVDALATL